MGQSTEELKVKLAENREALGEDLAAIGDRVSPGRMVERRRAQVRDRFGRMRETVMGAADSATTTVSDVTATATDTVTGVPDAVLSKAQGAPMAARLVAFGAGFLASSLMPATRKEQEVAARLQPALEEKAGEVGTAAQSVIDDVKERGEHALEAASGDGGS
jgi:hypothetical protein